ncbi:MAG: hypothetical protein ACTHNW_22365 [Mucilaginibacter sp.]
MRIENIVFDIQDDSIACKNDIGPLNSRSWKLELLEDKIIYSQKKKTAEFPIANIKELQYEADTSGKYDLQDTGIAYVLLEDDPQPHFLFSVVVNQTDFGPGSKTNASIICDQVLSFIGHKYGIPCNYKVSSGTKSKKSSVGLVVAVMIILPLLMWLMYRYNLV